MKVLRFRIAKKSLWTPTETESAPDVRFVPPLMRRKLSLLEKSGLFVLNAVAPAEPRPTIFASRFGEWRQTFRLLRQLREEGEISPAGFSLSVHNATPGIFSLIRGDASPYTAIAAGESTIESGLLETLLPRVPALFVYAEEAAPEFYAPALRERVPAGAFALAVEHGEDFEMSAGVPDAAPVSFDEIREFFFGEKTELRGNALSLRKLRQTL